MSIAKAQAVTGHVVMTCTVLNNSVSGRIDQIAIPTCTLPLFFPLPSSAVLSGDARFQEVIDDNLTSL